MSVNSILIIIFQIFSPCRHSPNTEISDWFGLFPLHAQVLFYVLIKNTRMVASVGLDLDCACVRVEQKADNKFT